MKELTSGLASLGERGRNFLFLRNLEPAYLMLLALARSKRDVARLHSFLPGNCQLLQNNQLPDNRKLVHGDLIDLERLWEEIIHVGNPPRGGQRISDELARSWLLRLCTYERGEGFGNGLDCHNLRDYYVAVLVKFATTGGSIRTATEFGDESDEAEDIWFGVWPSPFSVDPSDKSHGENKPFISLFSQEFRLRCYLPNQASEWLKVWLLLPTHILTADLLHSLATLPDFAVNENVAFGLSSDEVGLCCLLPATPELKSLLTPGQGNRHFVAKDGFAWALKKALCHLGVPLQGDIKTRFNKGMLRGTT